MTLSVSEFSVWKCLLPCDDDSFLDIAHRRRGYLRVLMTSLLREQRARERPTDKPM